MRSSDQLSTNGRASFSTVAPGDDVQAHWNQVIKRRSFLKGMTIAGAAAVPGSALLASEAAASDPARLTDGDAAILRLLAAAELIESDLWEQYTELGGVSVNGKSDGESPGVPAGGGNPHYVAALQSIDGDMPQYVTDNTDDEFSHAAFLNAYLEAHGRRKVDLDEFRKLPSSTATGARNKGRLTNLMNLNVDTSWYTRYRSTANVDFGGASFAQLLTIKNQPAIPPTKADENNPARIQAIANTAAFHFAFIEQGGSSLYTTLLQQVSSVEVLRIVASIGGTEIDHFSLWHDKVSTAVAPPNNVTDPVTGLSFPDLSSNTNELQQTNLILPEPCTFISSGLPKVSVIRPSSTANSGAVAAVKAFTDDNLFDGQPPRFFRKLMDLAVRADAARREVTS
ncbi:MAG: ferritin-like domain-containing protein [Solirubrobacterales bacterium]|nr:ferritin-like domain-containing protein [Solirubrobacterales bacterium]MBV9799281.1 ferritin-like domain-containing protein [Solirubrobacterales bacterium]